MSKDPSIPFDCVANMRETRDTLNAETADMSHDELVQWLRSHRYSDPLLQRLANQAAQGDRLPIIGR